MALAAKISPAELTAQVTERFSDAYLEARLINAPGVVYLPGTTDDAAFLAFEVPIGTGGYERQVIYYQASDVTNYTDDGVGLATRATVFAQNGSSTTIDFSHVALCWSTGNVETLGALTAVPSAAVNGTYTSIPIDQTSGSGNGLTVDLAVINSGATSSDYAITLAKPGSGYADGDTALITEATLQGLGIVASGAGDLAFTVATVSSPANAGQLLSVAQTSNQVVLSAGNEAAFYWNLKQFGFYNVAS